MYVSKKSELTRAGPGELAVSKESEREEVYASALREQPKKDRCRRELAVAFAHLPLCCTRVFLQQNGRGRPFRLFFCTNFSKSPAVRFPTPNGANEKLENSCVSDAACQFFFFHATKNKRRAGWSTRDIGSSEQESAFSLRGVSAKSSPRR